MTLIKCNECGKEISDKAQMCINCGCPIEKEMICAECGKTISKTDRICKNCGCPTTQKINNKNIILFFLGGLIILLNIVFPRSIFLPIINLNINIGFVRIIMLIVGLILVLFPVFKTIKIMFSYNNKSTIAIILYVVNIIISIIIMIIMFIKMDKGFYSSITFSYFIPIIMNSVPLLLYFFKKVNQNNLHSFFKISIVVFIISIFHIIVASYFIVKYNNDFLEYRENKIEEMGKEQTCKNYYNGYYVNGTCYYKDSNGKTLGINP